MMPGRPASLQRWRARLGELALIAASVILCLLVAEVGVRLFLPSASLWHPFNLAMVHARFNPVRSPQMRYDSELGHEPVPGSSGWLVGKPISYSADGMRNQNLNAPPPQGPLVLAVGDSTTEGYGVTNDETWPAHLERDTGWRVLNAGVRAYGLDQIVLRAERLAPRLKPRAIVLAFIADDVKRSALAVRHTIHKPYFVPTDKGLELRNVPVPTTPVSSPWDPVRRILGYSQLVDFVMTRLQLHEQWLGGDLYTGADPDLVACRLMDRFAALIARQQVKALVVGLPSDTSGESARASEDVQRQVDGVLACARRAALATLDTHEAFVAAGAFRDHQAFFSDFHLTGRGNAVAARLIASALSGVDH